MSRGRMPDLIGEPVTDVALSARRSIARWVHGPIGVDRCAYLCEGPQQIAKSGVRMAGPSWVSDFPQKRGPAVSRPPAPPFVHNPRISGT